MSQQSKNLALFRDYLVDVGRSALAIPGRACHVGPPGHNGVESNALALFARNVLNDTGFGQHVGKHVVCMPLILCIFLFFVELALVVYIS